MKKIAFATLTLGMIIAAPAHALEHEVTIESASGPIAADYSGDVRIDTKTVGTTNLPGRRNTQRCQYTVSVEVERMASLGSTMQARRAMVSDDVMSGTLPGRCSMNEGRINDLVDSRRDTLQVALMELVEKDREFLMAEAGSMGSQAGG